MQICCTEPPEQCLGVFHFSQGAKLCQWTQFVFWDPSFWMQHVCHIYSRQDCRILALGWERDLRRCSPSRSAVCISLNTGMHNSHTKPWAEKLRAQEQECCFLHCTRDICPTGKPGSFGSWWDLVFGLFSGHKLRAEWLINCISMTAAFGEQFLKADARLVTLFGHRWFL